MRFLRTLHALPPSDRRLLLKAALLLAMVKSLLRVAGLPAVRWLLGTLIALATPRRVFVPAPSPARIAWAVAALSRRWRVTCLGQALVTQTMLELSGFQGTMRIGVRRNSAGEFESHAWVECSDGPFPGQPAAGTFSPLLAFPRVRP